MRLRYGLGGLSCGRASSAVVSWTRTGARSSIRKSDGRSGVKTKSVWLIGTGFLGLAALAQPVLNDRASAQEHKPLMIHRLFTGPDGQTHSEEVEAKFVGGGGNDVHKLMANS